MDALLGSKPCRPRSSRRAGWGLSRWPPVQRIDWYLDVDADATQEKLDDLKRLADEQCPGVYCVRNPVELVTPLEQAT